EAQRREVVRLFLVVDPLQDGRGAAAAIFLGPGDAGVTSGGLLALPGLGLLQEIGIVAAGAEAALVVALARGVGVEPGAHLLAERGFFRRVVEVHDLLLHLLPPLRGLREGAAAYVAFFCSSRLTSLSFQAIGPPSESARTRARRQWNWVSASQEKPMPPWVWTCSLEA